MAGSRSTPAWMSACIGLSAIAALGTAGVWLGYYSRASSVYEEWQWANSTRQRLDQAKVPLQTNVQTLEDELTIAQAKLTTLRATETGERTAIGNLLTTQEKNLANLRRNLERIRTQRRSLLQKLAEVRDEWSREENLLLANGNEHEESLGRLRLQVKEVSRDIEREQKAARLIEQNLERDIERLKSRVQELVQQKETDSATLVADGTITAARGDMGFVIIDLGMKDQLRPGTRFQVFANRAGKPRIKGEIQVTKVEDRISQARIVNELDAADPILPGDQLHNTIFDPKAQKIFVISGDFSTYSKAELARFIQEAGGVVEPELSTRTNYLVAGVNAEATLKRASDFGVIILSENKLIEFVRGSGPRTETPTVKK